MTIQNHSSTWTRRQSLWLLAGAAGGVVLHGCNSPPEPVATAPGSASQPTTSGQELTVGIIPWIGYASHYVAAAKGFFQDETLAINDVIFQDTSASFSAVLTGQIDVNWITTGDVIQLSERDPSIRAIRLMDYSNGADGVLARGITHAGELKGKTIACEKILFEHVILSKCLSQAGLTLKDIVLVDLPAPDAATAFASGKVDAAVSYEPFLSAALKQGGGELLFSTTDTAIIADIISAREAVIQQKKEALLSYFRAIDKAVALINSSDPEVPEIVGKGLGISGTEAKEQLSKMRYFDQAGNKDIGFNPDHPDSVIQNLKAIAKNAVELNFVTNPVDASKLYDDSLINAL